MSENTDIERVVRNETMFGLAIREARTRQGITQAELAERLGAYRSYLSAVENGRSSAVMRLLMRAVRELGLEVVVRRRR